MNTYYIQYWSNLDEVYGEDCVEAVSEESARGIFNETDWSQHCEIVSVEVEP